MGTKLFKEFTAGLVILAATPIVLFGGIMMGETAEITLNNKGDMGNGIVAVFGMIMLPIAVAAGLGATIFSNRILKEAISINSAEKIKVIVIVFYLVLFIVSAVYGYTLSGRP